MFVTPSLGLRETAPFPLAAVPALVWPPFSAPPLLFAAFGEVLGTMGDLFDPTLAFSPGCGVLGVPPAPLIICSRDAAEGVPPTVMAIAAPAALRADGALLSASFFAFTLGSRASLTLPEKMPQRKKRKRKRQGKERKGN